jgi:hypothetical protein
MSTSWLRSTVGSLFAGLLALAACLPAQAETWRFALIGDTPYSDYERAELPKMLSAIAERHVEFIAHIGDFKSGSSRCDDALFEDRCNYSRTAAFRSFSFPATTNGPTASA